eukprot:g23621.t1
MQEAEDIGEDPWFGFEQEYYLLDPKTKWPLGWPAGKYPDKETAFYCSVGSTKVIAREVIEAHYRACLYAGVMIGGINSEVAPAQWEFQVGPASGTQGADDLWMSRYILQRLCEEYGIGVTFDPKPVPKQAGIGCHTNYSNMATRSSPGHLRCERLRQEHAKHIANYGIGNERRLTGKDDTAAMTDFSWGIGDRAASIRIGCKVERALSSLIDDQRPIWIHTWSPNYWSKLRFAHKVLLLQNYDIEKLGYLVHLRVLYGVVQFCCLGLLIYVRLKINDMQDDGAKVQAPAANAEQAISVYFRPLEVPATIQMGVEVKPAMEMTTKEYDNSKWFEQMQQCVIGCLVLTYIHVHWGPTTPLAFQTVTAPIQLLEAPLVKIHALGKPAYGSLKRPFPPPSLFGLPQLPQAEPVSKEKEKSKKDKSKKSK